MIPVPDVRHHLFLQLIVISDLFPELQLCLQILPLLSGKLFSKLRMAVQKIKHGFRLPGDFLQSETFGGNRLVCAKIYVQIQLHVLPNEVRTLLL